LARQIVKEAGLQRDPNFAYTAFSAVVPASLGQQLLVESLVFLNEDEAITYKYTPARDTLREKTSGALYRVRGYSPR
jgi:hypothetical protein